MTRIKSAPEDVPYYGPKSICSCGHTGDGRYTQHKDRIAAGHGACKVKGCECKQFTWVKWHSEYSRYKKLGR